MKDNNEEFKLTEYQMTPEEYTALMNMEVEGKKSIEEQGDKFNIQDYYDKVNTFWMEMGSKYGIDWSTVQASAQGAGFFLAEALQIKETLTPLEEEALVTFLAKDLYVPPSTKKHLQEIVEQIEEGCFSSNSSLIEQNLAFVALRKLSMSNTSSPAGYASLILPMTVKRSLKKIHDALEEGDYQSTDRVPLESYPAFHALKNIVR